MATNEQALYEINTRSIYNYGATGTKRGVALITGQLRIGTASGRASQKPLSFGSIFSLAPILTATPNYRLGVMNCMVTVGVHDLTNAGCNLSAWCFRPGVAAANDKLSDVNLNIQWHAVGPIYDYASFDA